MNRRGSLGGRDQHLSAFGAALMRFCDAAGALGAALVDGEGETVDYAGSLSPFDIKVAAAEWAIVVALLRESRVPSWPDTEQIVVRARSKSYLVQSLTAGYSLVIQTLPRSFGVSERALGEALRELSAEAGLDLLPSRALESEHWFRIDVRCSAEEPLRPEAVWVSGSWAPVEIIGRWMADALRREPGYRARLASGAELTLVREPLSRWYADARVT